MKSIKNLVIAIPLLVFIAASLYERVPVNEGLGWDGTAYHNCIGEILNCKDSQGINRYYIQRVSVSALLAGVSFITGTDPSPSFTVAGYFLVNLLALIVSFILYFRICRLLSIGNIPSLFGFVGCFYSYFILKMTPYYPVLLDLPAFAIAFVMLYAFLKRSLLLALLALTLGAFTFPTILPFGIFLFAVTMPGNSLSSSQGISIRIPEFIRADKFRIQELLSAVPSLVYIVYGWLLFRFRPDYVSEFSDGSRVTREGVLLNGFITCMILYFFTRIFLKGVFARIHRIYLGYMDLFILIVLFLGINIIQTYISVPGMVQDWKWFTVTLFVQSVQHPFSSLVSHIMYFGPVVILAILWFKKLVNTISDYGPGLVLFFGMNLVLLILGSESRQFVIFIPFLVTFLITANHEFLENILNRNKIIFLATLSLAVSRFWFTINTTGFRELAEDVNNTRMFGEPVLQRYFMSQGPWMTSESYMMMGLTVVLLFGIYLYIFIPRKLKTFQNAN